MRIKRDTAPASKAWQKKSKIRREELKEKLRKDVLPNRAEHCYRRGISGMGCIHCDQADLKQCTTYTNLAKVLDSMKIPGVRGNLVKWDATRVKRLFRQ